MRFFEPENTRGRLSTRVGVGGTGDRSGTQDRYAFWPSPVPTDSVYKCVRNGDRADLHRY